MQHTANRPVAGRSADEIVEPYNKISTPPMCTSVAVLKWCSRFSKAVGASIAPLAKNETLP